MAAAAAEITALAHRSKGSWVKQQCNAANEQPTNKSNVLRMKNCQKCATPIPAKQLAALSFVNNTLRCLNCGTGYEASVLSVHITLILAVATTVISFAGAIYAVLQQYRFSILALVLALLLSAGGWLTAFSLPSAWKHFKQVPPQTHLGRSGDFAKL